MTYHRRHARVAPLLLGLGLVGLAPRLLRRSDDHRQRPVYVGNFTDSDVSIPKVDGARITDTGKKLTLPGQPASVRGPAH